MQTSRAVYCKLPLILLTLDQTLCLEQKLQCLTLASHFADMQNPLHATPLFTVVRSKFAHLNKQGPCNILSQ